MTDRAAMAVSTALITADEYSRMQFDVPTELVQGEIVFLYGADAMTRPGFRHGEICARIAVCMALWAKQSKSGRVASNDSWITTHRDPDSVRGADVSYMSHAKLPDGRSPEGPTDIVPDLAVEVLSPSNTVRQINEKADEYLAAGIAEVWIVDPKKKSVQVRRLDAAAQVLSEDDDLTSVVLPGFSVRVLEFFEDV